MFFCSIPKRSRGIPFLQVVLNQPTIFEKATAYEKMRADEFNKKQKELSKELTDDEEEH